MAILTKRGNLVTKSDGFPKHYTKRYIGFLKMVADQHAKPENTYKDTGLLSWSEDGYQPLMQVFFNSKWNGMNLKCLMNREWTGSTADHYHSRYRVNKATGMYRLNQFDGKRKLNKLRERRNQNVNS